MTTMAEVIAAHLEGNYLCSCNYEYPSENSTAEHISHLSEQLAAAGLGHVPTALNEAADALAGLFSYNTELRFDGSEDPGMAAAVQATHEAADFLRARAAETGGTE